MQWIPEKPDVIYAAMAGGAIAFVSAITAAIITNCHARKRQQLDLAQAAEQAEKDRQHSTQQKEAERLHSLRREIYLPFIEEASRAVTFVVQIPTCSLDQLRSCDPMTALGRQYAKVSLIAPPHVLEPIAKNYADLQSIALDLINKRWAVDRISNELAAAQNNVNLMLERQKNLGVRIEAMLDAGESKPNLKLLIDEHAKLSEQMQPEIDRQGPLTRQKADLEMRLTSESFGRIMQVRQETVTAFLAMRQEIGLPIDENWYRKFNEEVAARAAKLASSFQDDLRKALLEQ